MHWFWRALLAIGIASLWATPIIPLSVLIPGAPSGNWVPPSFAVEQQLSRSSIDVLAILQMGLVNGVPVAIFALVVFWLLSRRGSGAGVIHETHCRKCNYILRGISEPRCPECGERI